MILLDIADAREAQAGPLRLPEAPHLWCNPLDDELGERLVRRSRDRRDSAVRLLTRDPDRFASLESLRRWAAERERVLCLHTADDRLLGVLWLAHKPLPPRPDYLAGEPPAVEAPCMTWAIRLYGPARGCGLATAFAGHGLRRLLQDIPTPPTLWYETKAVNRPVRRFTRRLGFHEVTGETNGSVIGVRPALPLIVSDPGARQRRDRSR